MDSQNSEDTMKIETSLNHQTRYLNRTRELYSMARSYSWTHQKLLDERRKQIFEDSAWTKVPNWVRAAEQTLSSELLARLYKQPVVKNDVVWQLYEDGVKVTDKEACDWSKVKGRHEWSESGKPFNEGTDDVTKSTE